MQVSNSKLTLEQKAERKSMRKVLLSMGGRIFSFPDQGVTFAVAKPKHSSAYTMQVGVAIMSASEQKFRRKVGEFYALTRLEWYHPLPMRNQFSNDEWVFEDNMYNLAIALTDH